MIDKYFLGQNYQLVDFLQDFNAHFLDMIRRFKIMLKTLGTGCYSLEWYFKSSFLDVVILVEWLNLGFFRGNTNS